MSTIPLPALEIRPPAQQPDTAEQYIRLSSLLGQQRLQQGQQQLQQQALQEGKIKLAQAQALNDSYKNALSVGPDGKPTFDRQKVLQSVASSNQGSLVPELEKNFMDLDKLGGEVQEAKDKHNAAAQEYFAAGAGMIRDMGYNPAAVGTFLAHASTNGYAQEAAQFQQLLGQDPSKIKPVVDSILAHSPKQTEAAKNQAQTASDLSSAASKDQETAFYKQNPTAGAPGVPVETVSMLDYMRRVPGASPSQFPTWKAQQEAKATQPLKLQLAIAEKKAEQAISDGDPNAAAQLLISGTVAPSQLISSRKPSFAQQAFSAAAQMQPGWTATKADADYKVASSPQNVGFFGSAKSLTDKGGTLDQLADAAKDIPSHQFPVFNTVADALRASTGSGPVAKYASIALGVADDYSKVMGGGQGSDTSRTQALNLISAKQSPEQRAASIEGIRGSVTSQTNSRIGNNAVLRKMYGDQLQSGGSSSSSGLNAQKLTGKGAKWGIAPVGAQ